MKKKKEKDTGQRRSNIQSWKTTVFESLETTLLDDSQQSI